MHGWVKVVVVAGSAALLAAMAGTWILVDLERAGWVASVVGGVVGVAGLLAGLLGPSGGGPVAEASRTGDATARGGGSANTGLRATGGRSARGQVRDSGDAVAEGPGSGANSGVELT
ncbi:hypothetical protein [Streptomyces profundus]|uniref:hypothetical protein n=1 Tax=Streptomyces profundus TaxID=2867410 RepID=UPI001D16235F|nr:hypothetical protein [Streptomyces sp. MA3_2.13]UED86763.1 hypothetical protein K4G22_23310 [Streptomyces sp. MA3_2.13]